MTDEQKYDELLKEIGQVLKRKNDDIIFLEYNIKELEKKLAALIQQLAEE